MQKIENKIIEKIELEQEISPFLFIWENIELLNQKINSLAINTLKHFKIPEVNLFKLEDNSEIIKIWEIKNFLKISDSKTPYKFQIILIENFSRANITSQNSCLKKLEEPWVKNIYFLTNKSESGILDTILSRVQTIKININKTILENNFYNNLINEAIKEKNIENLLSYFFKTKLEKVEYITFLQSLIKYLQNNLIWIDFLEELQDDIQMMQTNNLLPKITTDKWLLRIINDLA